MEENKNLENNFEVVETEYDDGLEDVTGATRVIVGLALVGGLALGGLAVKGGKKLYSWAKNKKDSADVSDDEAEGIEVCVGTVEETK